jgi:O-succinylbenzoic acid--CoA ligase
LDSEQIGTICFTSGSGGLPKGVQLSLGNHYHSAIGSNENIRFAPGDCWQLALPLCHVGGLGILFRAFIAGATVFIDAKFDARLTNERLDHKELTHLSVVPSMLRDLISDRENRAFPDSLKAVLLGGAAVPHSLLTQALALQAPIMTSYGMTETASQVTATRPGDRVDRTSTSGKVLNFRRLRIVDETGQTLPVGTIGNIEVGGEVLFKGYVGLPGSSPAPHGWFATGDVGVLDDEGYLTVVGRHDRMFISGGENIYPEEIESAALDHPGISAAACIALPNERWGQRPILVIETKVEDPEFVGDLRSFLSGRLARMMLPDRIIPVEELPRTILGKIDFIHLQQIVGTLDGGQSG